MPNFYEYNPEQAYLLPPSVKDVLGENHLCFFVHRAVEKLDLSVFAAAYSEEGQRAYHPAMQLKVWVYAYALGMTSSRRLEERIKEDLAFRYLAGGAQPDYWALNDFRRRHGRAMNDVFTQVVELARSVGMGKLGHVAIDSTRIAANAAADSARRSRSCARNEPRFASGFAAGSNSAMAKDRTKERERKWREQRWETGRTAAPDSRTDRATAEVGDEKVVARGCRQPVSAGAARLHAGLYGDGGVSEDHLIVAQQVSQSGTDNDLLVPMVDARGTGIAASGREK